MTQAKDHALKLALEALDGLYMPGELDRVNKAILAIKQALAAQPAPVPLTDEQIWDIKLKSHQKFMSKVWVAETDTRSGYYKDVERHTDSPVTFARAIEAAHGITAAPAEEKK
jgi:hypothetical protein